MSATTCHRIVPHLVVAVAAAIAFPLGASGATPVVERPLDLTWTAPDGCPSQAEVVSDVSRLVGTPKEGAHVSSVAVVMRLDSGTWRVRVRTTSDAGTDDRSIDGESCEAVAEATALFVALAVDPERGASIAPAGGSPPPPSAAPVPGPARTAPPFEPPPREGRSGSPAASEHSRLSVRASSRIDGGTLPRPAVGAELSAGWRTSRTLLEVAGTAWLTQSALLSTSPAVGGTFSMISGSVRGCYNLLALPAFALGPCAAGELDHVDAGGYGNLVAASGSTWWVALAAGGTVAWQFSRAGALRGVVEADAPLARPTFSVVNTASTYQAAVVSARAGIGVELAFP